MSAPTHCPICNSKVEKLPSVINFGGHTIRCSKHGEFEITESAWAEKHGASPEQWEHALKAAQSEAQGGARPRIWVHHLATTGL
jgi:hypothetical protein